MGVEALLIRPAARSARLIARGRLHARTGRGPARAEIADLALEVPAPADVELRAVVDKPGVDALVSVHDEVFGEDHSGLGRALLNTFARRPSAAAAVVAVAGHTPIAAGRVEFHAGTDFASLWGCLLYTSPSPRDRS